MKCIIILHAILTSGGRLDWKEATCLKEECRWWSPEMDQCDSTGLLPFVSRLEGILRELIDKMPHENQFRK